MRHTNRGRGRCRGRGRSRGSGRPRRHRGRGRRRGRGCAIIRIAPTDSDRDSEDEIWQKKELLSLNFLYCKTPGPTTPISILANESPSDLSCWYITDDVWKLIVEETNRYASANVVQTPNARPWHNTTVSEIKAFIGMLLLMGILELPRLEMYWQTAQSNSNRWTIFYHESSAI